MASTTKQHFYETEKEIFPLNGMPFSEVSFKVRKEGLLVIQTMGRLILCESRLIFTITD